MGVDKRDIRTVIHFSPPPSAEAYLQESGRGGRDGLPCEAILLFDPLADAPRAASELGEQPPGADPGRTPAAEGADPKDQGRERRRLALLAWAAERRCRREGLLALMGLEPSSPCSGCDVCEGRAAVLPEGVAELAAFLAANPARFDEFQCARLLALGPWEGCGRTPGPPACAGSGLLAGWEAKDLRSLIRSALAMGWIRRRDRGPRAGVLELGAGARASAALEV